MMNVGICESSQFSHLPHKKDTIAHSTDADLLRDCLLFIYIDLMKPDSGVFSLIRELFKDGRDDSARATPRSPKVDDDDLARVDLVSVHLSMSEHQKQIVDRSLDVRGTGTRQAN